MRCQLETNYPRPSGQTAESVRVGGQAWQSLLQLADDRIQVVEHPIGKLFFTHLVPHMFLRVEFGCIGWQGQEPDIGRDHQVFGLVRTGSVKHHHDEFGGVSLTDLGEKLGHTPRVHLATQAPIQLAFARTDGPVDINKLALVTVGDHRSQRRGRPASLGTHHASEPGLVLEHQAHATASDHFGSQQGCQRFGEFFFHSACTTGLFLGCRVSGATFRHPWRANKRYTTEGATFRPSLSASAARKGETTNTPALRADSTQGDRKAFSSSQLIRDRRRPPQRAREERPGGSPWRNRCCSRATVARPTPSSAAVSSKVVWATAGRTMA